MPARRSKVKNIDPDLLPESVTKVGPHEPLIKYFTEEKPPKELFEQWADYYEKKPQVAIRELISVILFIGSGSEIEVTDKEIKKCQTKEIEEKFHQVLEESSVDTPVDEFFAGKSEKAYDFWTKLCNSLIVSKGLFFEEFKTFINNWAFEFCESHDRTLRSTSTIAICSILRFLADSIKCSNTELKKLRKNTKASKSSVVKHQIETFETELENSEDLSKELYTSVLKPRIRDKYPKIREFCIKTMSEISILAPDVFGDMNFMKPLENALSDESSQNIKETVKQIESILSSSSNYDDFIPFFKSISPKLLKICNCNDNGISISTFELMNKMHKKKVFFCESDDTEPVFRLTGDDNLKLRSHAAKFFTNFIFKGTLLEEEELNDNEQEINESQLNKYAKLAKGFSEAELINSIQAFTPLLSCFKNWDLICEIIITANKKEDKNLFVKILSISASSASEKEDISNLTIAMVSHLQKPKNQGLLEIFKKNNQGLTYLTQILQYMDISVLSGAAHERQFKLLLEKLHEIFISNNDRNVYINIINGIHLWTKSESSPKKKKSKAKTSFADLSRKELENIANDYNEFNENEAVKLEKFLAISTFYDFSENKELRDFLKGLTDEDEEIIDKKSGEDYNHNTSIAIRCLENLFKWDVKNLKDKENEEKAEYSIEFFSLQSLFTLHLHSKNIEVKTAAFCALGTLLSLAQLVVNISDVDTENFEHFVYTFHDLDEKASSFKSLVRPILNNTIPMKYAVHAFWYIQDSDIKPLVDDFMRSIDDDYFPIEGSEIGPLIDFMIQKEGNIDNFVQPAKFAKVKRFMKSIASKINTRDAILSYINNNNGAEELIPAYAPIFENMSFADAEFVKPSAEGRTLQIINKIINGKKLKPKDFIVAVKKPKESDDESEDDEAESEGSD